MTLPSPQGAPLRPDLPWLRHRRVPHTHIEYVHPPRHRAAAPAPAPAAPASPPAPPAPATPAPPVPTPPAARRTAPSLDLSSSPATGSAGSLDLSARAAGALPTRRERPRTLPYPRVRAGATVVLTPAAPTVTLTRLQSGTGRLRVSLVRGDGAGDLELGMICQTSDGATHVVQRDGGVLTAPGGGTAALPLVRLAVEERLDTFSVDLRQVRRLRRALFYGHSPGVQVLRWDGVVVGSVADGSRVEAPFDLPPLSGTVALLSVYAVHGELVLRAELEAFAGPPDVAAQAYGYSYGWLGGRLPVI